MEVKSIYIHIPFCRNICSYCDFCKLLYNEKMIDEYLDALNREVEDNYLNEKLETIYIGGGTPSSLSLVQLQKLFRIVKKLDTSNLKEFTIEMNPEDIKEEKLELFVKNKVNRISIGHQTKHSHFLKQLNRLFMVTKEQVDLVKKYVSNISVDLMYGFSNQTKEELEEDIDYILSLEVPHISTYSLIMEEHTRLWIDNYNRLDDESDALFYEIIRSKLRNQNYLQYEISNFSREGYQSIHNQVYWNNQKYYGFGLGASGYIDDIRYNNTRSISNYIKGDRVINKEIIARENAMVYEMILGLRQTKGVSKESFFKKFGCHIEQTFDIMEIMKQGLIENTGGFIRIPVKYLYLENQILLHFLEVKNEK